ncbi:unnamed protein product [Closterium sp. NIES-53]
MCGALDWMAEFDLLESRFRMSSPPHHTTQQDAFLGTFPARLESRRLCLALLPNNQPFSPFFFPAFLLQDQPSQPSAPAPRSEEQARSRPYSCRISRLTPLRLLHALRNKLVLVFGDSVSKNLASSIACFLHAAAAAAADGAPAAAASDPAATGNSVAAAAAGKAGNSVTVQPFTIQRGSSTAEGIQLPSHGVRFASVFSKWLLTGAQLPTPKLQYRIDLDQVDPQVVDLLPLADIVVFQVRPLSQF